MQFMLHHFMRNVFVFLNEASGGRYILRYNKQYEYNFLNGAKKKTNEFSTTPITYNELNARLSFFSFSFR